MEITKIKDGQVIGIAPKLISTSKENFDIENNAKMKNGFLKVVAKVSDFELTPEFWTTNYSTIFNKELHFSEVDKEKIRTFQTLCVVNADKDTFFYSQYHSKSKDDEYYASDWYNTAYTKVYKSGHYINTEIDSGGAFNKKINKMMGDTFLGKTYYVAVDSDSKGEIDKYRWGDTPIFLVEESLLDNIKKTRKNANDWDNIEKISTVTFWDSQRRSTAYWTGDPRKMCQDDEQKPKNEGRSYYSYSTKYQWDVEWWLFLKKKAASQTNRKRKRQSKVAKDALKNAKIRLENTHNHIEELKKDLKASIESIPGKEQDIADLEKMIASTSKAELLLFANNKNHPFQHIAKDLLSCYLFNE